MSETLHGIIPPMTTPFTATGDVDLPAFRAQVRFLVDQGVHGLAVGGSWTRRPTPRGPRSSR
jgi:4-hydroxy-tetrahydrodipicolinate synthase